MTDATPAYVCATNYVNAVPGFPHSNPLQSPTTTLAVDLAWLAENMFSVSIGVNDNRTCYQTVTDALDFQMTMCSDGAAWEELDFESEADMALCISLNHLIRVQAYPNTGGAFNMANGSDLARTVRRLAVMCGAPE